MSKNRLRIAMVSPYPPPGMKHVYGSGVASYTKNLVEALRDIDPKIEIHVVADRREGLPKQYIDKGIVVHRVYTRSPLYILQVFRDLCRIKPSVTHIQHEYFLYGGLITAVLFPLLVVLSKLVSRKIIVTIHGVIPLKLLNNYEFRKENGIHGPVPILKLGLLLITKLIVLFSSKVIVHEPFLKEYLVKDYKEKPSKIVVIPHGVEDLKPLPKDEAKKKLGLEGKTVLLCFGYLTGYKGIKELLDAYREIAKKIPNTVLIIAGGPHPRLAREKWYRNWIRGIVKKTLEIQQGIRNNGKILFTGYVSEDKVPLYFSAADVVVIPYKARIAASGPEALAIAFEKCHITKPVDSRENISTLVSSVINALLNTDSCQRRSVELKKSLLWSNIARQNLRTYLDTDARHSGSSKVNIVLMITPEYPPYNIGGGGVVVRNIAKELSNRGYKVIVLAGYYKSRSFLDKPWVQGDDNVYVIWLPLIPTPKKTPYLDTVMPPNVYSAILLYKVLNRIKKLRNCIIHMHGYGHLLIDYAALLLRAFGKTYIFTIHGIPKSPLYLRNKLLKYAFLLYAKLIGRITIEGAAKVTAISKAIAKEAIAYGAKPSQIAVILNGINPDYANNVGQDMFRKKYNISHDKKVILCIGRLHPRKGFQYVIAAMPHILKEVPDTVLAIVGDGPYRGVLESLARKVGIEKNVVFTGYVDEQTKKEALADADIVVIPSLTEPFGLVALEAMAMKKLIIASNIDGLKEILHNFEQLLVNPQNIRELAEKIKIFLKDTDKYRYIETKLNESLKEFLWSNIVRKYITIYNMVDIYED
ncbi:MAG: glycosyltransferase [Ignisphaera sp.]